MNLAKILIVTCVVLFNLSVHAQNLPDEQIVDKHIPTEMLNTKLIETDPPEQIDPSTIDKKFKISNFNSKDGYRYIMAIYSTLDRLGIDNEMIKFLVIKVNKDGASSVLSRPKSYDTPFSMGSNTEMELFDLDGDSVSELIITNNTKGGFSTSSILKWSGTNLENITPLRSNNKSGIFNQLQIEALPLIVSEVFVDSVGDIPSRTYQKIQKLTSNGFVDVATFDFLGIVAKESIKTEERLFEVKDLNKGLYTLEVKNLSKHKHAIRAEISIDDVVVLKPADFCKEKSKKFEKQKDKKGNEIPEDDDEDINEDGYKRCQFKNDIYTDVTLTKANDFSKTNINVKLYGNKHSRIQVTLKKKN